MTGTAFDQEPARDVVRWAPSSPTTPTAEWNVIVAQADMLSKAEIVPRQYQGKPANIIAAAISGRVFGWDVMASMRNGNVIEGTYAIKPEAQLGLVRAAGHSVSGHATDEEAVVTGRRADNDDEITVTWTIDRAVRAGLVSIKDGQPYSRSSGGKKLPWELYTSAMLWARAVSELCRQLFSDVTLGLSYTADEVTDGAFSDDGQGNVQVEAQRLPPPEGWADWNACDDAHEAYIARWKEAPKDARVKMTTYSRDAGYGRPMTHDQLEELEGQLDILLGAPTVRVSTVKTEGAPDAPEDDTGDSGGTLGPQSASEPPGPGVVATPEELEATAARLAAEIAGAPEGVTTKSVDTVIITEITLTPDDEITDAEIVDETEAPEGDEAQSSQGQPPPPAAEEPPATDTDDQAAVPPSVPVPVVPIARNKLARIAMACTDAGIERPEVARLVTLITDGAYTSRTALSDAQGNLMLQAIRQLKMGHIRFGTAEGTETLLAGDEKGVAFLASLAEAIAQAPNLEVAP